VRDFLEQRLELEWKRLRAAWTRSRIFTDMGTPSPGSAGVSWLDGSAFINMVNCIRGGGDPA